MWMRSPSSPPIVAGGSSAGTTRRSGWRSSSRAAWELPCLPLLERMRGGRQRGSSAAERRAVRGAFRATGAAPRRVAVIDDVYTTGATASAAATALRKAGARRVEAVAFARALRRG